MLIFSEFLSKIKKKLKKALSFYVNFTYDY